VTDADGLLWERGRGVYDVRPLNNILVVQAANHRGETRTLLRSMTTPLPIATSPSARPPHPEAITSSSGCSNR
jgi:hypothetical protein